MNESSHIMVEYLLVVPAQGNERGGRNKYGGNSGRAFIR